MSKFLNGDGVGHLWTLMVTWVGNQGFLTSHQDITGKADKVSSATNGNFAGLDSNGNLTDSGKKASDFLTTHQDISGKADLASPAFTGTPTAPTASSGTNTTQLATTAFVQSAISSISAGASVFKGVVNAGSAISSLTTYNSGWYWVVGTAGTYVGQNCEVGDFIFCVSNYSSAYSASDFSVVQNNIEALSSSEIDAAIAEAIQS